MINKDELVKEIDQAERDMNVAKYEQELALDALVNHLMSTREVNQLPADIQRTLIDVTLRRDKIDRLAALKSNLQADMDLTP